MIYVSWNDSTRWGLTHWGRATHICVSNITIIDSDNGLLLDRRQAIIWTTAELLIIGTLGTNLSENSIQIIFIQEKAFKSVVCKMASRPECAYIADSVQSAGLDSIRWSFKISILFTLVTMGDKRRCQLLNSKSWHEIPGLRDHVYFAVT